MTKLFVIVNVDTFFLSHRKEIAVSAQKHNYDVTIVAKDIGYSKEILALGLKFIDLPINKTGLNLYEEWKTFYFLYLLFKHEDPDIVHLVRMKTVLWGGLAARLLRIKGIVTAISGLGVMFSPEYNKSITSKIVLKVLRFIHHRKNIFCIFHNTEDMSMFIHSRIVTAEQCIRTMGSGIDLDAYSYKEEPESSKIRVLFTARMVEDKGCLVLIEAANILRSKYENKVKFLLCGGLETNPLAIKKDRLDNLCDGHYIQWLGKRNDVHELLANSHIFAFPSYYKEGLPKSCIEAASIGRPIITCDSIGCKDTVIDGETGFLIPIKNSHILAARLEYLFEHFKERREMGKRARALAEERFSIIDIIDIHIRVYHELTKNIVT